MDQGSKFGGSKANDKSTGGCHGGWDLAEWATTTFKKEKKRKQEFLHTIFSIYLILFKLVFN